jgi:hypothetical protein
MLCGVGMMFFNVSKKICLRDAVFAFLLLNLYSHYRSVWTCGWMSEKILCEGDAMFAFLI